MKPDIYKKEQSGCFFMASVDRQQHALDVLKSLNKAITNIRLYPEQSAQAVNAVEQAYTELKGYLRLYNVLRFGLVEGVPTLDDVLFEKKGREQLNALSLIDFLNKAGFKVLILSRSVDRKGLKKILSFFSTTPEQMNKAGGSAEFARKAGLGAIFLEDDAQGNTVREQQADRLDFAACLKKMMASGVMREDMLFFLRPGTGRHDGEKVRRLLLIDLDKGAHLLTAVICFSLQDLRQSGVYEISSDASQLFENVRVALKDEEGRKVAKRMATLLTANLDQHSLALLFCQDTVVPFGAALFSSLVAAFDKADFNTLVDFLRQERERLAASLTHEKSLSLMDETWQRLMETGKGRQLQATDLMSQAELQRQSKRLQAGLSRLAQGRIEELRNKEIVLHLAATFDRLVNNKKEDVAAAIIQTLAGGLHSDDHELRHRAAEGLGLIAEKLVSHDYWGWLEKLTPALIHWVTGIEDADDSCNRYVVALQAILTHAQKAGDDDLVDMILPFLYAIRSGALVKSEEIRNMVGHAQDQEVDPDILQNYLERCFVKPFVETLCQKIVMHGPKGIQFLLERLLTNTKRPERIRLLKILASVDGLAPLLLERLREPMPWYGKRNLLRLLCETGDEGSIQGVRECLGHDDLRVQGEAFTCICKLSQQGKKQELLDALPRISEKLKFKVVQALASVVDEEVVGVLLDLLREEKYFSADIKTALLVSLCETLGRSGSVQAQKGLQEFAGKGDACPKGMDSEVWQAAQKGLALLDASRRQQKQRDAEVRKGVKSIVNQNQPVLTQPGTLYEPVTDLAEEREIYLLLKQQKRTAAKKLLLKLISTLSCLHLFEQAKVLSRRLIAIDPLALYDITKATALIEEQRSASIDPGQGMGWLEFYDFLNTEEFNAFYAALNRITYSINENIVAQGELRQQLFFINKGKVKVYRRDPSGNEILLKMLGSGDVLGAETFFKASFWTVNAASVDMVDAFVLSHEALRKWQNTFPGLESKLQDFCQQLGRQESRRVAAVECRVSERLRYTGRMAVAILDDQGRPSGIVMQGENIDISSGGLALTVQVSRKRNIRLLLGRKVSVSLLDGLFTTPLTCGMSGLVVAIYGQESKEVNLAGYEQFLVHIQFEQPLQEDDLASVISNAG
jgi:CRP-like cAMP-binding protein